MKILKIGAAVAGMVVLAMLLGLLVRGDSASADPVVITTTGIDMEPSDNTPGNIVDVETCQRIDVGNVGDLDVYMDDFPAAGTNLNPPQELAGYNYKLVYPAGFSITVKNHVNQYINLRPGSGPSDALSEVVPDADGSYSAVVSDFAAAETVALDGDDGVLGHYTISNNAAAGPAYYLLTLTTIKMINGVAKDQWDIIPAPAGVDTDKDGAIDEDLVLDGTYTPVHGIIAVGQNCPAPTDLSKNSLTSSLVANEDVAVGTTKNYTLTDVIQNNLTVPPGMDPTNADVTTVCTPPANVDAGKAANECSYTCVGGETVKCGATVLTTNCVAATPYVCAYPNALTVKETAAALTVAEGPRSLVRNWDLKCGEQSTHTWAFSNSITNNSPLIPDPNTGNNTQSLSVAIDCIGTADIGVADVLSALPPAILADDGADQDGDTLVDEDPPDGINNDGDGLTDEDGGTVVPVTITKTITNYGPYAGSVAVPVVVDWTATGTATFNGVTVNPWCTLTAITATSGSVNFTSGTLPESHVVTVGYVLHCNRSGDEFDDDGDSPDQPCAALPGIIPAAPPLCLNWVDEDPPDGVDNDSDGLTDEDGPLTFVVVKVSDTVTTPAIHVAEPSPDTTNLNTDTDYSSMVKGLLPFNPSFSASVDELNPATDAAPVDNDCLITMPCKRQFIFNTPAGNPLAGLLITQPSSYGAGLGLTLAPGWDAMAGGIPSGDKVGRSTGNATGVSILSGTCNPLPVADFDLYDGALPGEDPDGSTVANNEPTAAIALANPLSWSTKLGSVVTMIDLGVRDKDGDQKEDGTAGTPGVYQCADGVDNDGDGTCDTGGCATGLADANCLAGVRINEDPVDTVDNDGDGLIDEDVAEPDGFPALWGRKVGVGDLSGNPIPVNILIFNAGPGGWLEYTVFLDPDEDMDGIYDEVDVDDDNDIGTGTCIGANPAIPREDGSVSYGSCRDHVDNGPDGLTDSNDPDCMCGADFVDADDNLNLTPDGLEQLTKQCTPFGGTILELGQSVTTATTLATCDDIKLDYNMKGAFTRSDIGLVTTKTSAFKCTGNNDVQITKSDNLTPVVPVGLPTTFPVTITLTNGMVPTDVAVNLSIVTNDPCVAHWAGETDFVEVGPTNVSKVIYTELAMTANEVRNIGRNYTITCSAPVTNHNVQIVVQAQSTPALPDPFPLNNQAQNNPKVTATDTDVDHDTIPNAVDNCPWVANPDQLDTDDDGQGDACDTDDDNDGVPDATDNCDTVAEDLDAESDADGCPDSNVSLDVDKDDSVEVNVSENTRFTITATGTNGNFGPANLHFTELLKSTVGQCEARWVCLPGDDCVEDIIDGMVYSQLEVTIPNIAPFNNAVKVREYTVHCAQKSFHDNAIFVEESVAPDYPVFDPNVANNVIKQYIDVTAWANADVKIVAYEVHEGPAGGDLAVGVPEHVMLKKVVHNNGPYSGVTASLAHTPHPPSDCTITPSSVPSQVVEMPVSVQIAVFEDWIIQCNAPSFHTFSWDNVIGVTGEHVRDLVPGNNSASVSLTVPVIGTTIVEAAVDITNIPNNFDVSTDVGFNATKTFTNLGLGPVHPAVAQTFTPPADCELSFSVTNAFLSKVSNLVISKGGVVVAPPPGGWSAGDVVTGAKGQTVGLGFRIVLAASGTLVVTETWGTHCYDPSNHTFGQTTTVSRVPADDAHILFASDTDTGTVTRAVLADADLEIVDWYFQGLPLIGVDHYKVLVSPAESAYVQSKEAIRNNGPYTPVDVAKTITATAPAGCSFTYNVTGNELSINGGPPPAPGTEIVVGGTETITIVWAINDLTSVDYWQTELWSFHITEHKWECAIPFHKVLAGAQGHVNAPGGTADRLVTICADTDEDGVPDFCQGVRDNCVDVPNPDQADSDGDGVGDACDIPHVVVIKYCLKFGPAPVNISDNTGRYMWTICDIGNHGTLDEVVNVSLDVAGEPTTGCTMAQDLILPGQARFALPAGEQKFLLWRNRFECHDPVEEGLHTLTVTVCVDAEQQNVDHDGDTVIADDGPAWGVDDDGDSSIDEDPLDADPAPVCETQIRSLIVHIPTP